MIKRSQTLLMITNGCPPKWSQKSVHSKLAPVSSRVSEVANKRFIIRDEVTHNGFFFCYSPFAANQNQLFPSRVITIITCSCSTKAFFNPNQIHCVNKKLGADADCAILRGTRRDILRKRPKNNNKVWIKLSEAIFSILKDIWEKIICSSRPARLMEEFPDGKVHLQPATWKFPSWRMYRPCWPLGVWS